jgi:hypothetical protein
MTDDEKQALNGWLALRFGWSTRDWAGHPEWKPVWISPDGREQDNPPDVCGTWDGFGLLLAAMEGRGYTMHAFSNSNVANAALLTDAEMHSELAVTTTLSDDRMKSATDLRLAAALAAKAALEDAEEANGGQ